MASPSKSKTKYPRSMSIRFSPEQMRLLKEEAKEQDRQVAWLIRNMVDQRYQNTPPKPSVRRPVSV